MADEQGRWDGVVDDLARTDRRPERAVLGRLRDAARELDGDWCRSHPLTRRRVAGTAARDALAVYLLAGGTPEHLGSLVHLLGVVGDGRPTTGNVADRAAVARRLAEAVAAPDIDRDRVADCHRYAAALERSDPGPHVPRPVDPTAVCRAQRAYLTAAYLRDDPHGLRPHPDGT